MRNIHFLNALLIIAAIGIFIGVSQISVNAEEASSSVDAKSSTTSKNIGVSTDEDARTDPSVDRNSQDASREPRTIDDKLGSRPAGSMSEKSATGKGRVDDVRDSKTSTDRSLDRTRDDNGEQFSNFDNDRDGSLSEREFADQTALQDANEIFKGLDSNNDGRLDKAEFDLYTQNRNDAKAGISVSR